MMCVQRSAFSVHRLAFIVRGQNRRGAFPTRDGETHASILNAQHRTLNVQRVALNLFHSCLNAIIGSILIARIAGTRHAPAETMIKIIDTATNVSESVALTSYSSLLI